MNFVITLQGWFSLKFIRAWIRVYFPMCAGQDARVLGLWFMGRCFSHLSRRWLKAQCIRSRISPPRISSFFLKPLSHWVESLKFKLANVEFGHKKWGWRFMMIKTCFGLLKLQVTCDVNVKVKVLVKKCKCGSGMIWRSRFKRLVFWVQINQWN